MTLRDASVLAYTKFRTRKLRSILVIIGSASITALVLFFSITATGLKNSVNSKVAPLESLNLLSIRPNNFDFNTGQEPTPKVNTLNSAEVWEKIKKDNNIDASKIKNVFYAARPIQNSPATLSDLKIDNAPVNYAPGQYFEARSAELLQVYVAKDQSLTIGEDGVLPVIVSADVINQKYQSEINAIKNVTERVKKVQDLQRQYIGKVQDLTIQYIPQDVDVSKGATAADQKSMKVRVKIIGFSPATSGILSAFLSSTEPVVNASFESVAKVAELKAIVPAADTVYVSFDTRDSRTVVSDKFKNQYDYFVTIYGDISGSIQGIFDSAKAILKWIIIAMLVFVTLPMMSTMGKILADSQRETGVFRAIGARNKDIAKIYATYSAILATLAFIVGVIIASAIALILNAKYSTVLTAQLTEISGSGSVLGVSLYGISVLHWTVLFLLLLSSAILGATIPVLRTLRKDPILAMRDE